MIKKIFFILAIFFSVSAFTQKLSEGLKAKNDGNEAFKIKDYVSAISYWEKYMESGEKDISKDINTKILYVNSFKYASSEFIKKQDFESALSYLEKYFEKTGTEAKTDSIAIFNFAYSALKLKKNEDALNYFQKSNNLGYKADVCKLYMAEIFREWGLDSKEEEILIAAITQHPTSKYLNKMASMLKIPLLRKASIPFNQANVLAKEASISTHVEYNAKMNLACEKFRESIPLFEKVLKYIPGNEQAINCIKICRDNIQYFNDNKAGLLKK